MVKLSESSFGLINGDAVRRFTWETEKDLQVSVISYGAIITSIKLPDKNGVTCDVVLGFDNIEDYVKNNKPYLGAIIGRCANRIGRGTFEIDAVKYQLAKNIGENHLHGGLVGFDKVNWKASVDGNKVTFSYLSKDGEEGYPGDLITNITYEVTEDGTIHVDMLATTTKKTVVNLTNHSYFNLAGHQTGVEELYKHIITLNADKITETNAESIPTGRFLNVGGTSFDLRSALKLGEVISPSNALFDNNFCVSTNGNKGINFVARAIHPESGRFLELYSDQPGVQLYTSNFLPQPSEPALIGKGGVGYRSHGAFCLETQNYPDAVNHPNFPDAILKPGQVYKHLVKYTFGVEKNDQPSVYYY